MKVNGEEQVEEKQTETKPERSNKWRALDLIRNLWKAERKGKAVGSVPDGDAVVDASATAV